MLSVKHCPRHSGQKDEANSVPTHGAQSPYRIINIENSKVMLSNLKYHFRLILHCPRSKCSLFGSSIEQ